MDRPELAIVIPALNEAKTIGPVVQAATAFGQVFVVDDGSGDGTGDVARAAGAMIIRHDVPCGYEASLGDGCAAASDAGAKAVVTMDADGEHDPALLREFRRLLIDEDMPLVLGVRPRRQRLAESLMGLLFRWHYGVSDALCGMKGYHLDLYRQNGGFDHVGGVGTELAIQSIRRGTAFREIPVSGNRRVDRPRFGKALQSNLRIVCSLCRVMRLDPAKVS
tara:strand:+ start:3809 stop:4471 length:663 start_codon:yes stop_codon:yes gene_type:complete